MGMAMLWGGVVAHGWVWEIRVLTEPVIRGVLPEGSSYLPVLSTLPPSTPSNNISASFGCSHHICPLNLNNTLVYTQSYTTFSPHRHTHAPNISLTTLMSGSGNLFLNACILHSAFVCDTNRTVEDIKPMVYLLLNLFVVVWGGLR